MATNAQIQFHLGQIVATPGAIEALERNRDFGMNYIRRHALGDWGMVCEEDKQANNEAVKSGERILSAYLLSDETKVWIITDGVDDTGRRNATTILLPEEY